MFVKLISKISWAYLIPIAIILGLAPFQPEPHLTEKLRMLIHGDLVRPVDIMDLFMHGTPLILVILKLFFRQVIPSDSA